jgi:hypothetical protein
MRQGEAATHSTVTACGLQNSIEFNDCRNLVRDQGVGGSNPLSPTILFQSLTIPAGRPTFPEPGLLSTDRSERSYFRTGQSFLAGTDGVFNSEVSPIKSSASSRFLLTRPDKHRTPRIYSVQHDNLFLTKSIA